MLKIRNTTLADAEILADIQRAAFWPIYDIYHDAENPCLRGPEDISRRLDSPVFRCFTIEYNDDIVGGLLYRCSGATPFMDELPRDKYYLTRAYIRPDMQSKHIAREAILMCENEFPGAKAFHVDFPEQLEKNRKCYEACGFKDTGKRLEAEPGLVLACYEKRLCFPNGG